MKSQSLTLSGLFVFILSQVVTPDEADVILQFIHSLVEVASIVMIYYGRFRQGDITWYGKKVHN